MQRSQIDAALRETITNLLNDGADPATIELALIGAVDDLKADAQLIAKVGLEIQGPLTRDEAEAKVEGRIFEGEETACSTLEGLCANVEGEENGWEIGQQTLERLGNKGLIQFRREGGRTLCSLTPAGRAEAQRRMAEAV